MLLSNESTFDYPQLAGAIGTPVRPTLIQGYTLSRQLGQGSSATVYLAKDASGAKVAIKLLAAHYIENREVLQRWSREAQTLVSLKHPNIVAGIASGVAEGRPWFAMEYVQGETLSARLRRKGPLGVEEVYDVARQSLSALAAAHAGGIIHRDVKPANMIRGEGGLVKLTDFGLARHIDDPTITMAGAVIGTPAYVSPEQARGDELIDHRADLYSLGITLFHLATGDVPFSSFNTSLLLTKKVTERVPDVRKYKPDLDGSFAYFLDALCQRDPGERIETAKAALALLDRCRAGDVPSAPFATVAASRARTAPPAAIPLEHPMLQTVVSDSDLKSAPIFLEPGEILFYEDDDSKDCYILLSGSAEVLKAGRQVAIVSEPGAFVGEMSTLRNAPRSATIRAREASAFIKIEEAEFRLFLRRHPDTHYQLACVLAERLEETSKRLSEAQEKLARIQRHFQQLRADLNEPIIKELP
ncbi:MAG: serine/threonine-protein kinase [Candidatus Sumerlaeia bacterium]|nr:serine/threonine-protein kinase [Candidatus Sumerlaeia bacterium]